MKETDREDFLLTEEEKEKIRKNLVDFMELGLEDASQEESEKNDKKETGK